MNPAGFFVFNYNQKEIAETRNTTRRTMGRTYERYGRSHFASLRRQLTHEFAELKGRNKTSFSEFAR